MQVRVSVRLSANGVVAVVVPSSNCRGDNQDYEQSADP
jgi:hypothetical protein